MEIGTEDVLTQAAIRNAMVVHAAFGGSTNLLLHIPAIAHAAGLRRPTVADWTEINRQVPRMVDALPNGPRGFATVQVFLGGRRAGSHAAPARGRPARHTVKTVTGESLDACLDWWKESERRRELRRELKKRDGIDPDDVIMSPSARASQMD